MSRSLMLFGAGASFGSDAGETPPLGPYLYTALAGFSPETWGRVRPEEASCFRDDFEKGMRAFAKAHPNDGLVDQLHCAMGGFFFRFRPSPTNLYRRLAERIRACNWEGTLASLNYERLLELSLSNAGVAPVLSGTANSRGGMELCLPHGCCNLFCNIRAEPPKLGAACSGNLLASDAGSPVVNLAAQGPTIIKPAKGPKGREILTTLRAENGGLISLGPHLRVDSDEYRVLNNPDEHAKESRESTIPPVMCYFQPEKDTRAGVSFI